MTGQEHRAIGANTRGIFTAPYRREGGKAGRQVGRREGRMEGTVEGGGKERRKGKRRGSRRASWDQEEEALRMWQICIYMVTILQQVTGKHLEEEPPFSSLHRGATWALAA